MDILVREFQRGQGVLQWDAKHGRIRKAMRMRWLVDDLRAWDDRLPAAWLSVPISKNQFQSHLQDAWISRSCDTRTCYR